MSVDRYQNAKGTSKKSDEYYTPQAVYEAVRDWACKEYGLELAQIVRPFFPGGDYENFTYPAGCVVLDNPPFSILANICLFYLERNINFFLFAPGLTMFSARKTLMRMNHILCDASIVYENGKSVNTGFLTNLGGNDIIAQTAPELGRAIADAANRMSAKTRIGLPNYIYPTHLLTPAMLNRYAKYGIHFAIRKHECVPVEMLDAQKKERKQIFGGGLLLSDAKAAERMAAERAATERAATKRIATEQDSTFVWQLSDREREIISQLG